MKLALIRRRFSQTGGAELYLERLLTALDGAGHQLHLFAEAWEPVPTGVQFHPLAVSGRRAQRPARFAAAVQTALDRESFDCVFSLERTLRQDVYRAGDGVHRVWLERRRQFAPWWRRLFVGRGYFHRNLLALEAQTFSPANTGHVIVNSNMVRGEILRHFAFPADRIHLVRNGIDTARFQSGQRAQNRARWGVAADDYLLLFVGSGWERKGLSFLLRALAQLPEATGPGVLKLLVVGKGRPPPSASARVIFAGPIADVEQAYAAADLFVFLPLYEPSANVCLEALAAGLPVVTTAQNGAAEWLEPGVTGTLVPHPAATAAVVQAVQFWQSRRSQPRLRLPLEPFSLERNVAETLAILELAARDKAGRSTP